MIRLAVVLAVRHRVCRSDQHGLFVVAGIREAKENHVFANKKRPFVGCVFWKVFSKLPFVGRVFWKVFAATVVLLVAGWILIPRVFGYEIESQDYGGSSICAPIMAYLIHLWILPGPDSETGDQ